MSHRDSIDGTTEQVREQAIAWLARLRAGPDREDAALFEQWYAADPRHADVYDALLNSWDDTALLSRTSVDRQTSPTGGYRWARLAQVAAAALLLIVVGNLAYTNLAKIDANVSNRITSRIGQIRSVTLTDGSRLTLDTDSVVEHRFNARERRLRLIRGRVRFAVAHDPTRPFVVNADGGTVIAHGTLFDVDLHDTSFVVALLEGSVEIRQPMINYQNRPGRMLKPGQQVAVRVDKILDEAVLARPYDSRWPSGMLSFEDAPLSQVVASANRYSERSIILQDSALETLRFTGTFRAGEPEALVDMIDPMFALAVEQDAKGRYLLSAAQ